MKSKIVFFVTLAAFVGAFSLIGALTAGGGSELDAPQSTFSIPQAEEFDNYPLYDVGNAIEGYPRVAVLKDIASVSFIYGDCEPVGDTGCAPPITVQVWPACIRHPGLYEMKSSPTPEKTTVRGVPAAFFENGSRLEIQAGTSTIVIFAADRVTALKVAAKLRGVNNSQGAGNLPTPPAAALTGDLNC